MEKNEKISPKNRHFYTEKGYRNILWDSSENFIFLLVIEADVIII